MKVSIYDPIVKAYREVEMGEDEVEKYIDSAKKVEKLLKKGGR